VVGYIPDCQHKYYPKFFSRKELFFRDLGFSRLVKNSAAMFVNARAVKDDLVRFFGADPAKVFAAPFAPVVNEAYLDAGVPDIAEKYRLPERYFMISNQFWMHKDHPTAFRAFAGLGDKRVGLVCTGETSDYRNPAYMGEMERLLRELGIDGRVNIAGFIPKRDQIELMKRCAALVQPSLFEGGPGGGSTWEAVGLGVPCAVSDIPVNREIDSDSVTFFRAGDHGDLRDKMERLLDAPKPRPTRDELVRRSAVNRRRYGASLFEVVAG
jgi:glycosyltransferase involved in cell wall biosynthesis